MHLLPYKKNGFSLIEILIVISFISVMVILIFSATAFNNKVYKLNQERTQALFYAKEAMEAVHLLDWEELNIGTYSLGLSSGSWILNADPEIIDGKYNRSIVVSPVQRSDSQNSQVYGDIVSSGGHTDPDTKQVIVTVSWNSSTGVGKQEKLETYLHRWDQTRFSQTDWVGGSGQGVFSDETMFFAGDSGIETDIAGIVTLQAGFLDWSQATTTATYNTSGNFDDNDVYEINDTAYLVTENNPYGSELYILNVSDISNPWLISSLDIGSSVTSVVVKNDYAYLSTSDNAAELKVIDVSDNNNPQIISSYDLPSNDNAHDLAVDETEVYILQGSSLYAISILDPNNPQLLDQINLDSQAIEIFLAEDYVYVATEASSKELQIIEVTNPANLSPAGQYDLPGSLKGTDVVVRGTRAFISTQNNGSGAEFFIFEISDPTDPVYIGNYELGETVHSFAIVGPYALLGTNFLNEELVVLDVSYPATINMVSGFDLDGYVLGMSANCSVIYAATSGNQGEFFIISTQVADCAYADFGTLESSTIDTGHDELAYNWISWSGSEPANTNIRFQLATSNSQVGPWNFVGPDGTNSSYYTIAAQELINYNYHLNQRYFRYKLFLESSSLWQVPILEEVIISYSPY